jgi:hypothetical protein
MSLYPNPLPTTIIPKGQPGETTGHDNHSERIHLSFNERPLFLGDSDFAVDLTGATDSTAAVQAAINRAQDGVAIEVPLRAKIRVDGTIDLGSGSGSAVPRRAFRMYGASGHDRNSGSPGFGSTFFMPTTSGTMFTASGVTAAQNDQWGPVFEYLNFRDSSNSGAGGSATLFNLEMINYFTFRDCTFLYARTAVNLDSKDDVVSGGDSAWGIFDQCTWMECGWGIKSRRTYGHVVLGGQAFGCGQVDGNNLTGAFLDLDARSQGWRVIGIKIDGQVASVNRNNGIVDLGSSNEYIGVHFEKCVTCLKLDGDTGVTGPPSGNWRSVIGCTMVCDGGGTGLHLTANSGHTNYWGNNIHSVTTAVLDESPNGGTGSNEDNNVKIGQTHSTPGTPTNGVMLYVDSSGNLLAKTKLGNVRTVAAV